LVLVWFSLLEVIQDKVRHLGEQMKAGITAKDPVVFIRVDGPFKRLVGLDQGFDHPHTILNVYIIIGRAVDQEELPF
jgi:hypothetical protein